MDVRTDGLGDVALPPETYEADFTDLVVVVPRSRRIEGTVVGVPARRLGDTALYARPRSEAGGANGPPVRGEVRADGTFVIDEVTFTRGVLQASSVRGVVSVDFEFAENERTIELVVEFPPPPSGFVVSGTVMVDSQPHSGRPARLLGPMGSSPLPPARARDGSFLIEGVEAGGYVLVVEWAGSVLPYLEPRYVDQDQEIRLELQKASYSGRVSEMGTNEPIPGASIAFEDPGAPRVNGYRQQTTADGFGRFSVHSLGARERIVVAAYAEGFLRSETVVGPDPRDRELAIHLEPAVERRIRVELEDGTPVENGAWRLFDASGRTLSRGWGKATEGILRIAGPRSGVTSLVVTGSAGWSGGGVAEVELGEAQGEGTQPLTVRLPPSTCLQLLIDPEFARAEGWPWLVELTDAEGRRFRDPTMRFEDDRRLVGSIPVADACSVSGLSPGVWTARFESPDGSFVVREVEISPERGSALTLGGSQR